MNNQLVWILEPATQPNDEEGRIMIELFGKRPDCHVAIHMDAMADTEASAREGRPIFHNATMISVRNKGEKDFVSVPYTADHARQFPRAAKWWDEHQNDKRKVSVALLPGITPAEIAELAGIGITDLESLIEKDVPAPLQAWRDMALRFRTLSKPRVRLVDGELQAA